MSAPNIGAMARTDLANPVQSEIFSPIAITVPAKGSSGVHRPPNRSAPLRQ